MSRRIKASLGQLSPSLLGENPPVNLVVPEDIERLALCIIVGTR